MINIYGYKNTTSSAGKGIHYEINPLDIDVARCWFNSYGNPSYVFHMTNDDMYYLVDDYGAMEGIRHISRVLVERKKDMFKKWGGL
jgi:hypothetical protein